MIEAAQQLGIVPQGWQCPLCKRIWNPQVQYCPNHIVNESMKQAGGVAQGDPFDARKNVQGQPFKDTYR